jgi:hypothetical protein
MKNKAELKDRLKYLNVVLEQLKQDPMVKKYFAWLEMSDSEKSQLINSWKIYYTQVWQQSHAARIFREMSVATKQRDTQKVKDLLAENNTLEPSFKKPSSVDPMWLERACPAVIQMRSIEDQIAQIKETLKRGGDDELLVASIFGE